MTTPRLFDHHLEDLRASGLSEETIRAAGLYSATNEQATMLVGFGRSAALAFPYPHTATNGNAPFTRVKFDEPSPKGKRYAQAKGAGNRLYIPATLDPAALRDPSVTLYITEGEKKALKAVQEGLRCVSVSGVDSWKTRVNGKSEPIPDLDLIAWRGRQVFLVYDSDISGKTQVRWAEYGLARELTRRGAKVEAVRLPGGPNGRKVGLDDFLCTHSAESLCALEPIPILHPERKDQYAPRLTLREVRESYLVACRDPRPRTHFGFKGLDTHLRGIAPGEVAQVLARSGVGKTQFLLNVLLQNADRHALLFSLEMPAVQIFERLAAMILLQPATQIAALSAHDSTGLPEALLGVERRLPKLALVDAPQTMEGLDRALSAYRAGLPADERVGLVLLDYLGMVIPPRGSLPLYERVSEAARGLKMLARRHEVPILSACQISREGEDGSVPVTLNMARDSGAIEEAADYVLGMWRPDVREPAKGAADPAEAGKVLVRVLKNRSGPAHKTAALRLDLTTLALTDW